MHPHVTTIGHNRLSGNNCSSVVINIVVRKQLSMREDFKKKRDTLYTLAYVAL